MRSHYRLCVTEKIIEIKTGCNLVGIRNKMTDRLKIYKKCILIKSTYPGWRNLQKKIFYNFHEFNCSRHIYPDHF